MKQHDSTLKYGTVVCGGGPAGIGPLIYAIRKGKINALLDQKIALVEKTNELGGGNLINYNINSNTLAKVLLESLDSTDSKELFIPFISKKILEKTKRIKETYPSCFFLGDFLNILGKGVSSLIEKTPGSTIYKETFVEKIYLDANNELFVHIKNGEDEEKILHTKNVLLTMGAEQDFTDILSRELKHNINLLKYSSKIALSSKLLIEDKNTIHYLKQKLPKHPKIVIIGGSHSAWSCAWYLLNKLSTVLKKQIIFNKQSITIMSRSNIRLFYHNKNEAIKDGYYFDEQKDVCPLSGRVHRFSGLRGDSFELARKIVNKNIEKDNNPIQVTSFSESTSDYIISLLESADIIIPAFGYRASTVPIFSHDNKQIELAFNESGLITNENACVLTTKGKVISNIIAFGLGAGMKPSNTVGGEASLSGRIDGVWLFQNDVGKIVLSTIFSNLGVLE